MVLNLSEGVLCSEFSLLETGPPGFMMWSMASFSGGFEESRYLYSQDSEEICFARR